MRAKFSESFGDWYRKQFNTDDKDFSDIGDIVLAGVILEPQGGSQPVEYREPTLFKLSSNADGSMFKLTDMGKANRYTGKAAFPHGSVSDNAGSVYLLTKDQYEQLLLFPAQQQMPQG